MAVGPWLAWIYLGFLLVSPWIGLDMQPAAAEVQGLTIISRGTQHVYRLAEPTPSRRPGLPLTRLNRVLGAAETSPTWPII
jgi:hypothetical protein